MSQYDVVTLENNYNSWREGQAEALIARKIDPFEYFCVDQFLKFKQLTDDDLQTGMIGRPGDGGLDAFFFLANDKLGQEEEAVLATEKNAPSDNEEVTNINVAIFQVKEGSGFSATALEKLRLFTERLLDFRTPASHYKGQYHDDLIQLMHVFKTRFMKLAEKSPPITFDYYYITKLDNATKSLNDLSIKDAENRIRRVLQESLSLAEPYFHYIDAAGLLNQIRRHLPDRRILDFSQLWPNPEGYVGLAILHHYYRFLTGIEGGIEGRLFDSNVRGYQASTDVNKAIKKTLEDRTATEFWLLNNGITILATAADTKGFNSLEIVEPQIVNGLQTSREIFAYYKSAETDVSDERRLMVRVVRIADDKMREAIVRATNSQNAMLPAALRSTDEIHEYIDDLFAKHSLFYDRRPGHHKDQGKPIDSIVSIVGLLQAMVAIVLGKPHEAYGAPGRYIKNNELYASVFGEGKYPLDLFLTAIEIQRRIDSALLSGDLGVERGDRLRIRLYLSTYVARVVLKKHEPTAKEIGTIKAADIDANVIKDCHNRVMRMYKLAGGDNVAAKSSKIFDKLRRHLKNRYLPKESKQTAKPS